MDVLIITETYVVLYKISSFYYERKCFLSDIFDLFLSLLSSEVKDDISKCSNYKCIYNIDHLDGDGQQIRVLSMAVLNCNPPEPATGQSLPSPL